MDRLQFQQKPEQTATDDAVRSSPEPGLSSFTLLCASCSQGRSQRQRRIVFWAPGAQINWLFSVITQRTIDWAAGPGPFDPLQMEQMNREANTVMELVFLLLLEILLTAEIMYFVLNPFYFYTI